MCKMESRLIRSKAPDLRNAAPTAVESEIIENDVFRFHGFPWKSMDSMEIHGFHGFHDRNLIVFFVNLLPALGGEA